MVAIMTIASGLVGAIILFLVLSLTIEESKGTISLFKIFGYKNKAVANLITNSGRPIVLVGFLLAIPMVLVSGNALYGYLGETINLLLPMIINPWHVLISFILICIIYEGTKRFCSRKIAKIPMSEALKVGME